MNLNKLEIVKRCRRVGCKAKTAKGILAFAAENKIGPRPPVKWPPAGRFDPIQWNPKTDYVIAIRDPELARKADDEARAAHPRRQNWEIPCAVPTPNQEVTVREKNCGNYSRSCTYTRWEYTPLYHSAMTVARNGKSATLAQMGETVARITPPKGMHFRVIDGKFAVIRETDGMDYHPTLDDITARNFRGRVRRAMAENYRRRIDARKAAKRSARENTLFARDSDSVMVRLEDSTRAGNCVIGSLGFAERKLGIGRDKIMGNRVMFSVRAKTLRRVANGDGNLVENAIRCAWERETTISI